MTAPEPRGTSDPEPEFEYPRRDRADNESALLEQAAQHGDIDQVALPASGQNADLPVLGPSLVQIMEDEPAIPKRRQHAAWIAISAVRQLRGFALPVAVLLLSRGGNGDAGMLTLAFGIALVTLLWQGVSWRFVTYGVADGRLRMDSGVFARRERFVPIERVQAVDIGETPLQRVFGVVGVRIETAAGGSSGSDIVLQAVRRDDAEALRSMLLRHRQSGARPNEAEATAQENAVPAGSEGELVRRLRGREIVVAGATSGRIGPALAVVSFGLQFVDNLLPERFWRTVVLTAPGVEVRGVLVAVGIAAVLAWGLSIGGAVLTWSNFEIRRDGDRLSISHGLLDRRRRSIPLARMQAVSIHETPLRRLFGLAEIRFESAAWAGGSGEAGVLLPVVPVTQASEFISAVAPGFRLPLPLILEGPPTRAQPRYLTQSIRRLGGLLVLALLVAVLLPAVRWWWAAAAGGLVFPLAIWDGRLAFLESGWAIDEERFVVRRGGLSRRTTIAPLRRLQWRALVQNPLSRRAHLASIFTAVAAGGRGGGMEIRYLDEGDVNRLLSHLAASTASRERNQPIPPDGAAVPHPRYRASSADEWSATTGYT